MERYTLVQHSAYARRGQYQFKNMVEVCEIENNTQAVKVLNAGGAIFLTMSSALAAARKLHDQEFGEIPFSPRKISHRKNQRIAAVAGMVDGADEQ